jgi:hypothetical protein
MRCGGLAHVKDLIRYTSPVLEVSHRLALRLVSSLCDMDVGDVHSEMGQLKARGCTRRCHFRCVAIPLLTLFARVSTVVQIPLAVLDFATCGSLSFPSRLSAIACLHTFRSRFEVKTGVQLRKYRGENAYELACVAITVAASHRDNEAAALTCVL